MIDFFKPIKKEEEINKEVKKLKGFDTRVPGYSLDSPPQCGMRLEIPPEADLKYQEQLKDVKKELQREKEDPGRVRRGEAGPLF